jgi:hypothetical protein
MSALYVCVARVGVWSHNRGVGPSVFEEEAIQ